MLICSVQNCCLATRAAGQQLSELLSSNRSCCSAAFRICCLVVISKYDMLWRYQWYHLTVHSFNKKMHCNHREDSEQHNWRDLEGIAEGLPAFPAFNMVCWSIDARAPDSGTTTWVSRCLLWNAFSQDFVIGDFRPGQSEALSLQYCRICARAPLLSYENNQWNIASRL